MHYAALVVKAITFWFITSLVSSHLVQDLVHYFSRVGQDTPCYKEPTFIVFFSMLLSLFTMLCFKCKKSQPRATMKQMGITVIVSQHCTICSDKAFPWRSQPLIFGEYPAGNALLSFGVLMAGASISKVLLVMRHTGLCAYSARRFSVHQKNFLFPVILNCWEKY